NSQRGWRARRVKQNSSHFKKLTVRVLGHKETELHAHRNGAILDHHAFDPGTNSEQRRPPHAAINVDGIPHGAESRWPGIQSGLT
ncbi:MAG TPA: hypothetical protein VE860_14245, partial [Chthoniobacterales bacterium]|nr:hypothetical protein [Chthoniobacterales bacterium]